MREPLSVRGRGWWERVTQGDRDKVREGRCENGLGKSGQVREGNIECEGEGKSGPGEVSRCERELRVQEGPDWSTV